MIFDPVEQRLCVRIVYDGAGGAGKTTNLKALAGLLPSQNASEVFSPGELEGRTLYFDWLQVMAGVICGYPLLCQVISVPGQTVMTPRRRHLLSTADVVVLVCDSDPVGVERAREGLARVAEVTAGLPLVVQANKQDHVNALSGESVLAALGCEAGVVEAIATDGVGVVDTFVDAVRLVAKRMQDRCDASGLVVEVGRAAIARDLHVRLERETLDPAWAAEMLLEEAQAAFLLDGGFAGAPVRTRRQDGPSIPRSDVETGFVWPAHGRALLDTIESDTAVVVDADGIVDVRTASLRLRTSRALRFDEREGARQALVRAARERTQLDQGLAVETVLVLQPGRDGAWWLWTVMRDAPTLPAVVDALVERSARVAEYGCAIASALRVCVANGFTVDLRPTSFAVIDDHVAYVGVFDGVVREIGAEVVAAMDEVARRGWESDVFLEAFERELGRLTPEEATRIAGSTGVFRTASTSRQRLEHTLAHIVAGGAIQLRTTDSVA